MSLKHTQDTNFTTSVKTLSRHIYGKNNSMLEEATAYFIQKNTFQLESIALEKSKKQTVKAENNLVKYNKELAKMELEREERRVKLDDLCHDILALCEGDNYQEDNRKSSQLLATIQLLIPQDAGKIAHSNALNKPLYKAVLCLRILDRLCIDNKIHDTYIKERLADIPLDRYQRFSVIDPVGYKKFVDEVKIPLIKAALLQDIGNNHPSAQLILKGQDGTENPYRLLCLEERKKLLQIDYSETINYLIEGIGVAKYSGDLKAEQKTFNEAEKRKLIFIKALLKGSINPKKGIGNLLKVPQLYTSMVLSTKENYNYSLLPKVYQVLYKNVERGVCHREVVDVMYKITGAFPLGYGVTFITENQQGEKQYGYEYAIVKSLYPENPEEPNCRTATRNLTFISFGQDLVISQSRNLYFPLAAKKLNKVSKERLNEILELLSSNYTERKALDIIPRCWFANEYFSEKNHQKLWSK